MSRVQSSRSVRHPSLSTLTRWGWMAAALCSYQASGAEGASAAQDTTQIDALEQVVVTATRRETTLHDAPLAVSSFNGDLLERRQINSVADLNGLVPGLQFGASYADSRIAIRGIGTNNQTGGAEPGVSYHLDGVYIGTTGPAANAFYDIARVEVLRGPQGTLFGRNATGGSVNVIPNAPTAQTEGRLATTLGVDPFQSSVEAMLNGALNEQGTLSGRLSLLRSYNEGYSENLGPGGPDRLGDDDSIAVRGQLRFEASDDFDAKLSLEYRKQDANGAGVQLVGGPGFSITPAEALGGHRPRADSFDMYQNQGRNDGEFRLARLSIDATVGPGKLKALFSAGRTEANLLLDGDGTEVDFTTTQFDIGADQYFAELIYDVSPIDGLDVIVGLNAYRQDLEEYVAVGVPSLLPAPIEITGDIRTDSVAAFAHAEYQLTSAVQLFGGLRYTQDSKDFAETNSFVGALAQSHDWNRLTYEVGVSADLGSGINVYAKHATGFKSGGFQAGNLQPPADPERNANSEIGLKGFFGRSLEINLAAFHMKYEDLQVQQVRGLVVAFENAAKAEVNGLEAEINWQPADDWRVEAVATLLQAEFDEFRTLDTAQPALGMQDLSGNQLPNAPKTSFSLGVYRDLETQSRGTFTLGGRYYWQDEVFFSEFNVPVASQSSVGRVDLSLDWSSSTGLWESSLFARNLTNEAVRSNGYVVSAVLGSASLVTLDAGRFIGVSLSRKL